MTRGVVIVMALGAIGLPVVAAPLNGCSVRSAPALQGPEGRSLGHTSQALAQIACSNGAFVLDYEAPNPSNWQQIADNPNKPAFVVIDDIAADNGTSTVGPAWFHQNVPGALVIKYLPLNDGHPYAGGCAEGSGTPPSVCTNVSVRPFNCVSVDIPTRIQSAFNSGYDGIFFDEADAPVGYVQDCAARAKVAGGPNALVIVNPGRFPPDLSIFNDDIDIVSVENQLGPPFAGSAPNTTGVPAIRWMAVQNNLASLGQNWQSNFDTFRQNGGFWYYGTDRGYSDGLASWTAAQTNYADSLGRPDCAPATATPPTNCGVLTSQQGLTAGTPNDNVASCNQQYALWMQTDGNLVLYNSAGGVVWASNTVGTGAELAVLQGDGNFVLYTGNVGQHSVWATNTFGQPGAYLAVQDDGNLVVYTASGNVIWALNSPVQPAPGQCGVITTGQGLSQGTSTSSCSGQYTLTMQLDGDLVLFQDGAAIWGTGTGNRGNLVMALMQGDGNFVLYDRSTNPWSVVWPSNTAGHDGATFTIQDDGNLVILDANNAPVWSRF